MFRLVVIYRRRRRTCLLRSCDQVKCAVFVFIFSLGCSCLNNVLLAWCMLLQTEVKIFCVHCIKTCTFLASELIILGLFFLFLCRRAPPPPPSLTLSLVDCPSCRFGLCVIFLLVEIPGCLASEKAIPAPRNCQT